MTRTDKPLGILLRIFGVMALFALVAVVMPKSWIAGTHQWLGLGEFPDAPIVLNLARSLSAFYALFGAACLVLAADLDRYRPLVRFLGLGVALFGAALIGIDLTANMPLWWTLAEGPPTLVVGVLIWFLARHDH